MRIFGYEISFRKARNYAAAQITRLTNSWTTSTVTGDTMARMSLRTLRARSRQLARDNDYIKKYLRMNVVNILGAKGINFQSKVKLANGEGYDNRANTIIEAGWPDWGKKKNSPDVTGKLSWKGIQKMILRTVVRDGEILVRKVKNFPNKYRFAVQLIECDHLDETLNKILPNGNEIRMGVELNLWKQAVAFWLLTVHPGDYGFGKGYTRTYQRIPAGELLHIYDPDRVNDTRGIPWPHTAMLRANMLGGYEEAELVAARVAAAKMGFFTTPDGQLVGDDEDSETKDVIMEADPGTFDTLPEGVKLESWDPQHPAGNFPPFVKQMLRGMASGLGVSYAALASDLESVNFSSIRSGTLEERDNWKELQDWFIEDVCEPIFCEWLQMFLLQPGTALRASEFERLCAPKWAARSWAWVDPLKDMKANVEGLKSGLLSYTKFYAELGEDFEEQLEVIAKEREMLKEKGLDFDLGQNPASTAEIDALIEEQDDEEKRLAAPSAYTGGNGNGRH